MGESWTKKMGESTDWGGYRGISKGELRGGDWRGVWLQGCWETFGERAVRSPTHFAKEERPQV